jgi:hypothetical protein
VLQAQVFVPSVPPLGTSGPQPLAHAGVVLVQAVILSCKPDGHAPASPPMLDPLDDPDPPPESVTEEPEVADPEVLDPEVADPEVLDPEVADPEVLDPEVVDPEVLDVPEVAAPESSPVAEPELEPLF